jgi:hypothetical protein
MKTLLKDLAMFLLILVLGLAGCAAPATQPPPTPTPVLAPADTPLAKLVLEMVERLNAGDLEGSLAYFSDDAMSYVIGLPPTGMEVYAGKEQLRALWQDSVDNHFQWEVKITSVDDSVVSVSTKTWHDFTRQLGVAPLAWSDAYEIRDGKIIAYSTTITSESLAKLKPALAEVMPPEPTSAPSTNVPVSEMTVTIAGGTCTTENPLTLQAGEVKVNLDIKDQNKPSYALTIFNLDAGKDILDLMAATVGMQPSWADMLLFKEVDPGTSETYTFTVEKGPVYLVCWAKPLEIPIGNAGPFEVK